MLLLTLLLVWRLLLCRKWLLLLKHRLVGLLLEVLGTAGSRRLRATQRLVVLLKVLLQLDMLLGCVQVVGLLLVGRRRRCKMLRAGGRRTGRIMKLVRLVLLVWRVGLLLLLLVVVCGMMVRRRLVVERLVLLLLVEHCDWPLRFYLHLMHLLH